MMVMGSRTSTTFEPAPTHNPGGKCSVISLTRPDATLHGTVPLLLKSVEEPQGRDSDRLSRKYAIEPGCP